MTVRIVTDSTCDIPSQIAEALGITVVPAYVHFGDKTYRDGVDISGDEFYRRLQDDRVHPTTSAPSPGDFAEVYDRLSEESNEIVSVVVTSKLSAVYKSAVLGKEELKRACRVEVVDSESVSMGLGLVTMAAAEKARLGAGMEEVLEVVWNSIPRIHVLAVLDTLKYALRGGRLGGASRLLGAMIKVKPMITMRNGEVAPVGLARTRVKGLERLYEFVKKRLPVEDIAVVHNTVPKEAESLVTRLKSLIPEKESIVSRVGPGLGVHGGPGALVVALRQGRGEVQRAVGEERRGRRFSLPSLRVPR